MFYHRINKYYFRFPYDRGACLGLLQNGQMVTKEPIESIDRVNDKYHLDETGSKPSSG